MFSSFTGVAPERLAGLKADEEERQEVAGNSECRSSLKKSQRKRRRLSGKHSGKKQEDNRHPHLTSPHTWISLLRPATTVTHFITLNLVSTNLAVFLGAGY